MPLFGEIVIPSSRALWDDDFEETRAKTEPFVWNNETSLPSRKFEMLLIFESPKLNELVKKCLLDKDVVLVSQHSEGRVSIYELSKEKYLILCGEGEVATSGEIAEKLIPWIENANNVIAFNSLPSATFLCNSAEEKPSCFLRTLSTGNVINLFAPKLEAPNLATGISAGVLSYCHHMGLTASLYVCYLESHPLDSTTAEPILHVLRKLNVPILRSFKVKIINNESNLYM